MVGIPIRPSTRPGLLVDIEAGSLAMEGKGGRLAQPGQPRGFICQSKTLLKLAPGVQLIEALLGGPDERVKRGSRHRAFLVSALFPTAFSFLPTPQSIPERRPAGKEFATIRSVNDNIPCRRFSPTASARAHPEAEAFDVLPDEFLRHGMVPQRAGEYAAENFS
jgi:hypothetical protein